jgi:hypothetical protein
LFPGQPDVDAETHLRPGALVSGLHDARSRSGNDHEPGLPIFAQIHSLLMLHLGGQYLTEPKITLRTPA